MHKEPTLNLMLRLAEAKGCELSNDDGDDVG